MIVSRRKVVAIVLLTLALPVLSTSQQPGQVLPTESAAASAFENATQAEAGRRLKRIYRKRVGDLCTTDARRFGDGIVGYERITFVTAEDLASKVLALVHEWKTTGSQHPLFDAGDFPKIRRYAVANCGVVDNQTKVVIAVYHSAWDTYWQNWANLLGK